MEGISRRRLLGWLGVAGLGAAAGAGGVELANSATTADTSGESVPFHGAHQAGITTPRQTHLVFAALDVTGASRRELRGLLAYLTEAARRMTQGLLASDKHTTPAEAPWDSGEAVGLGPSRLTITFGAGPTLFTNDRLGLGASRPPALVDLPAFRGDRLDPARSGGDLCIQACADDRQVAFHAVRELLRLGHGFVEARWSQAGFLPGGPPGDTPRNLLGFKDGTNNVRPTESAALNRYVWVGSEGPAWMRGGTYLVVRRVTMSLDKWDGTSLREQENTIGRIKGSGAPLGGVQEHDPVELARIPRTAHIRLAAPASNGNERILRRPYSFDDGADGRGEMDAGLFFLAYQRDPRRQFIPIQDRLSRLDALNEYIRHTGSAIYAVFPGVRPGSAFGQSLLLP